jgi:ribonuclease HI
MGVKMFIVYTDGACSGNPGPGGWAYLVEYTDGKVDESYGFCESTTNNRMEMQAAISALEKLPPNSHVKLFSDSKLLVQGATDWMFKWRNAGWKKPGGLKNADLWIQLYDLNSSRNVQWAWVKGHNGNPKNDRVDLLARKAIKESSGS